jgi:hypothetical protein
MGIAKATWFWARWFGWQSTQRGSEPADLGTAFGMEVWLTSTEDQEPTSLERGATQARNHRHWWTLAKR